MEAKKCDICQKYYDNYKIYLKESDGESNVHYYPVNRIKLGNNIDTYYNIDVCPECMKNFLKFIGLPNEIIKVGDVQR